MKNLKTFSIFESTGVPSGLTTTTQKLFKGIVERLERGIEDLSSISFQKKEIQTKPTKINEISFHFLCHGDFKIGDMNRSFYAIKLFVFEFEEEIDGGLESKPLQAAAATKLELDKQKNKLKPTLTSERISEIHLTFISTYQNKVESLVGNEVGKFWSAKMIEILEKNKTEIFRNLGHELMHTYDLFKKGGHSVGDVAVYEIGSNLDFGGITAIDKFFYNLYFLSSLETVVYPSEIAAEMKLRGINKSNFLEFLKENRVYKQLKEISSWTADSFDEELMSEITKIRSFLKEVGAEEVDKMNDSEVLAFIKKQIVGNLSLKSERKIKELIGIKIESDSKLLRMTKSILRFFVGGKKQEDEIKDRNINSFINNLRKNAKNPDVYFRRQEKFFQTESQRLIRKISGLFSESEDLQKNDLHSKIYSRAKQKMESLISWELFKKF